MARKTTKTSSKSISELGSVYVTDYTSGDYVTTYRSPGGKIIRRGVGGTSGISKSKLLEIQAQFEAQKEAARRAAEKKAAEEAAEAERLKRSAEGTKRYEKEIASRQVQPTRSEQLVQIAKLREQEGVELSRGAKAGITNYEKGKRLTSAQLAALTRVMKQKTAEQLGITKETTPAQEVGLLSAFQQSGELEFGEENGGDVIAPTKDTLPTTKQFKESAVVSAVPTTKQRYQQMLKTQNPVTGTIGFAADLGLGYLGRKEAAITKKQAKAGDVGQSLFAGETGERVKTGAKIAPFFIPGVGAPLAAASGFGQFTKGGLVEAKEIGKAGQEKFGIPSKVGTGAFLVGSGALAVGGTIAGLKQAEKALGLSKLQTEFVAVSKPTTEAGKVTTTTLAKTTKTGLTPRREFLTTAKTETLVKPGTALPKEVLPGLKVTQEGGKQFAFVSKTRGLTTEPRRTLNILTGRTKTTIPSKTAVQLPTGKVVKKSIEPFEVGTVGVGKLKEKDLIISSTKGLEATRKVPGYDFISASKVKTPSGVTEAVGAGTGARVGKGLILSKGLSRTVDYGFGGATKLTKVKGTSTGFTKITSPTQSGRIMIGGRGKTSVLRQKGITQAVAKADIQQAVSSKLSKELAGQVGRVKVTGVTKATTSEFARIQNLPRMVGGGGKQVQQLKPFTIPTTITAQVQPQRTGVKLGLATRQLLRQRTKQSTQQTQFQQPTQKQLQRLGLGLRQLQRQRQVARPRPQFTIPKTVTPRVRGRVPGFAFGFPIPSTRGMARPRKRRVTRRPSRPPVRSPSLLAITRGITAPRRRRGEISALVVRPFVVSKRKKRKVRK